MSLQNYITERLNITSNTRSALRPTSKEQLEALIKQELEQQGPNVDLNHIDVSGIDNMYELFYRINKETKVGNIKIDQWDVSNVLDMEYMFHGCYDFNADLSKWDTRNVKICRLCLAVVRSSHLIYLNGIQEM